MHERATRYLEEGRLTIERADDETIVAICASRRRNVRLGFDLDRGWWCGCPINGPCHHLAALMRVTRVPGYRE